GPSPRQGAAAAQLRQRGKTAGTSTTSRWFSVGEANVSREHAAPVEEAFRGTEERRFASQGSAPARETRGAAPAMRRDSTTCQRRRKAGKVALSGIGGECANG